MMNEKELYGYEKGTKKDEEMQGYEEELQKKIEGYLVMRKR